MRIVKLALLVFFVYVIQSAFLPGLNIYIRPNLLVVLAMCFALREQKMQSAAFFASVCGILLDAGSGSMFGVNTLMCMLLAMLCVLTNKRLLKGAFWVCLLFMFIMGVVY